jgi:two-component system sensor histidine kinase YesM
MKTETGGSWFQKAQSLLSLRVMLLTIFLVSVTVPALFVMVALPSSYDTLAASERRILNDSILDLVSKYLDDYMDSMEQMTLLPLISPDFVETLKERNQPATPADRLSRKSSDDKMLQMLYDFMSIFRKDIESWVFITSDGTGFAVSRKWGSSYIRDGYDWRASPWYTASVLAGGRAVYVDPHPQDYLDEKTVPSVFSVARVIRDKDTLKPQGVVMVDQNTVAIDKILGDLSLGVSTLLVITDSSRHVIYGNKPLPSRVAERLARGTEVPTDADYEVMTRVNQRSGWHLYTFLSWADLNRRTFQIFAVGILFLLGNLVFGFFAFTALSRAVTRPLSRVGQALKAVEKGDLSIRLVRSGSLETRELQGAINSMLDRIQHLIQVEYQTKLDLRDAEYKALLAQVQPHFLYNVLYCLLGLNQLGRREELQAAVYDLHDMLRYTLESSPWTTVADECAFLGHYCTLQRLRFEDRFSFEITLEPGVEAVRLPRLLLQPLVENAILHGIEPVSRPCRLVVSVTALVPGGRGLRIVVADDGLGFDPASPVVTGHGLGMTMVGERLKNSCPEARWTVTSSPGQGTVITLEVPE